MNIAAYCRVSTEKEDQLNSLEAQKKFFADYTAKTGDNLVRLYADEGISGTKIKNRKEFLRMTSETTSSFASAAKTVPAAPVMSAALSIPAQTFFHIIKISFLWVLCR